VYVIHREVRPDVPARQYADDIRNFFGLGDGELPHFDIAQQGMGPNAHTGSLFPDEPLIGDCEGIAAEVYVEKLSQWRITLLSGALLAARHSVFLLTGEDQAVAALTVFNEEYDPKRNAAQVVSHHGRRVAWSLDKAAAKLMKA